MHNHLRINELLFSLATTQESIQSTAMAENDAYTILIDGTWSLKDFYQLPHVFAQVYAFNCAFLLDEQARDPERLASAFSSYPWQGGYSAVNFYTSLSSQIPLNLRPKVKAIQYASPGYMELGLWVAAATAAAAIIKQVVESASLVHKLYSDIYKGLQERKLVGIEIKRKTLALQEEEITFLINSSIRLSEALGFKELGRLNELTSNPLATMKILLSYYRRIRTLAEYEQKGKAQFPEEASQRELDN